MEHKHMAHACQRCPLHGEMCLLCIPSFLPGQSGATKDKPHGLSTCPGLGMGRCLACFMGVLSGGNSCERGEDMQTQKRPCTLTGIKLRTFSLRGGSVKLCHHATRTTPPTSQIYLVVYKQTLQPNTTQNKSYRLRKSN